MIPPPDDDLRCCRCLVAVEPPDPAEGFDIVEVQVSVREAGYFDEWLHLAYDLTTGDIGPDEFRRAVSGFPPLGAERFQLLSDPRWTLIALGEHHDPVATDDDGS
jgi:hypothetical protein